MLGSFGDIVFETSDKRLLNFKGFKRDTASVYENHKLMGQKPRTEFVAPGLDTVTFTVILRSRFGVKPRDEMNRWIEYARSGNAETLEIGGRALGVDKWVVTSASQHWDTIYNRGELVGGKVDVTLQEYVSTMWTVKAYQDRLKKLEAGKAATYQRAGSDNSVSSKQLIYNDGGYLVDENGLLLQKDSWEEFSPDGSRSVYAIADKLSDSSQVDYITNNTTCIKPTGMKRPAMIHYIMKKLNAHKAYSAVISSDRLLTIERTISGSNGITTYEKQLSRAPVMIKGMEVIDTQDIIDKFGSTNEIADLVSHLPEVDSFAFAEHAAIGFLLKYNGKGGPFVSTIWENDYNMYVFESPEEIKSSSDKPTFSIAGSVALVYTDISSIGGTIPTPITDLDVFYVGPGSVLMKKPGTDKGTREKTFNGISLMIAAEDKIPYIYSVNDNNGSTEPKEWTSDFDSTKDLTFGIGHSIKTKQDFDRIKNELASKKNPADIEAMIHKYFDDDISEFVKSVNDFTAKYYIYLTQYQFDAIVMLTFNTGIDWSKSPDENGIAPEGSSQELYQQLYNNRGVKRPVYDKNKIIEGFTYTKTATGSNEGLITRHNNELNLFFNGEYNYYDTKEKVIAKGIDYISYNR